MSRFNFFGDIAKTEELDDGTIIVTGFASTTDRDNQQEITTAEAMKAAIPEYMTFGNIREMHQPKAAGVALKAEVQDDGKTLIEAHIVDAEAVKKVKSGVYKGFSIGGTKTSYDSVNKTITGLRLSEISLVDRPANPNAVITCFKADGFEPVQLAKQPQGAEIKKSLYNVEIFSESLADMKWVVMNLYDDVRYGDHSDVMPKKLQAWLESGAALFSELAAEEAKRIVDGLQQYAANAQKVDKEMDIQKAEKALADAQAALAKVTGGAPAQASEGGEDKDSAIAKMSADFEAQKAELAAQKEINEKMVSTLETLVKKVDAIGSQPAEPKGSVSGVAVGKAQDGANPQPDLSGVAVYKADGSLDEVLTLINASHSGLGLSN